MSAPNNAGDYKYGVAKVLSETTSKLCYLAMSQIALISHTFNVGFVGVSSQTNLVLGLIAFVTFSGFVISTKSTSNP